MFNTNFWIWLTLIGGVGGFGLVSLVRAYVGRGGQTCLFAEPMPTGSLPVAPLPLAPLPPPSTDAALDLEFTQTALTKASAAFVAGRYRWAIDQYSLAVQTQPDLAVAYHNRGLAAANLRQLQDAAQDLAKAADLYLDQDNPSAAQQVYAHLQTLKSLKSDC